MRLFEDSLTPALDCGAPVPVLEPWWQEFSGLLLYHHDREHLPAALRALIDYVRARRW